MKTCVSLKTCLIVDDTSLDRKMTVACAEKIGFFVNEAASGEEALEICTKTFPDCILLDWEMKGMDGITFLGKLRSMDGGSKVAVVICTSHEHPSFVGHAYVSGATGFITKPITPQKLKAKIKELGIIEYGDAA